MYRGSQYKLREDEINFSFCKKKTTPAKQMAVNAHSC